MQPIQNYQNLPVQRPTLASAADNYRFRPIVECARLICGLIGTIITTVRLCFSSINLLQKEEQRSFSVQYWRLLRIHALQESKYAISALVPLCKQIYDKNLCSQWAISLAIVKEADLQKRRITPQTPESSAFAKETKSFIEHAFVDPQPPLVCARQEKLQAITELLKNYGFTESIPQSSTSKFFLCNESERRKLQDQFSKKCMDATLADFVKILNEDSVPARPNKPSLCLLGIDATHEEVQRLLTILQKHCRSPAGSFSHFHARFFNSFIRVWNNLNFLKPEDRNKEIKSLLDRLDQMTYDQFNGWVSQLNTYVLQHPFLIYRDPIERRPQTYVKKDFVLKNPELPLLALGKGDTLFESIVFLQDDWKPVANISDDGGPSNDFVFTLFNSLFSGNKERLLKTSKLFDTSSNTAYLVDSIPEYTLPVLELTQNDIRTLDPAEQQKKLARLQKGNAQQEKALCIERKHQDAVYRGVGNLFAQCYQNKKMVTGYFFPPSYFHLLQEFFKSTTHSAIFANESAISRETKLALLKAYRNTVIAGQRDKLNAQMQRIQQETSSKPNDKNAAKQTEAIASIRTAVEAIDATTPQDDDQLLTQWDSHKNKIRAALLIAEGMKERLADDSASATLFVTAPPAVISESIQGAEWDFEAFKKHLLANILLDHRDPEMLEKAKKLFNDWIGNSEQRAHDLCYAITGSPTNFKNIKIHFSSPPGAPRGDQSDHRLKDSGATYISTCSQRMTLYGYLLSDHSFPTEEERTQAFAATLEVSIQEALSAQSYFVMTSER